MKRPAAVESAGTETGGAAPSAVPPPRAPRLAFVDALRGLAVVLMVVNHTARWWLAPSVGAAREAVIYVTMVLSGPTFLLLVGFSLALAHRATAAVPGASFGVALCRNLRRAAGILAAGALVNLIVFPADPLEARVLVSIALGIALATPLLPLLPHAPARAGLLLGAPVLYALFLRVRPALAEWSGAHPLAANLLLREFPLLPWFGLVLLGLGLGWLEAAGGTARSRDRRYAALGAAGLLGLAAYGALGFGAPLGERLAFGQDLVLNGYWTAAPVTALGMAGALAALLAAAYAAVERGGWRPAALLRLGRAALFVYVLHLILVLPLGQRALGVAVADWPRYALATTVLLAGLVAAAPLWGALRARVAPREPAWGGWSARAARGGPR
jgi:uncharacterized membrane protein